MDQARGQTGNEQFSWLLLKSAQEAALLSGRVMIHLVLLGRIGADKRELGGKRRDLRVEGSGFSQLP
eukprot:12888127-Prorocentrum_lima.AAC.1